LPAYLRRNRFVQRCRCEHDNGRRGTQFHDLYYDSTSAPSISPLVLVAISDQNAMASFAIAPGLSASPASLTVNLWPVTSVENVSPDHALRAYVNGVLVGRTWNGGGHVLTRVPTPGRRFDRRRECDRGGRARLSTASINKSASFIRCP
jgi:hypothetical protein